jgi:hypothetical protein
MARASNTLEAFSNLLDMTAPKFEDMSKTDDWNRIGNIAARIACRLRTRREEIQERAGDARVEQDAAGSAPAREETDAMAAGGRVGPTAGEKCRRPATLVISGRKSPRGFVELMFVPACRWHAGRLECPAQGAPIQSARPQS